jgi:hypothetical protein
MKKYIVVAIQGQGGSPEWPKVTFGAFFDKQ